jgi:hypothetical protein
MQMLPVIRQVKAVEIDTLAATDLLNPQNGSRAEFERFAGTR